VFEARNHFLQAIHTFACARFSTLLQLTLISPAMEVIKPFFNFAHKRRVGLGSELFVCRDTAVEVGL